MQVFGEEEFVDQAVEEAFVFGPGRAVQNRLNAAFQNSALIETCIRNRKRLKRLRLDLIKPALFPNKLLCFYGYGGKHSLTAEFFEQSIKIQRVIPLSFRRTTFTEVFPDLPVSSLQKVRAIVHFGAS